jgi:hypothetical protein
MLDLLLFLGYRKFETSFFTEQLAAVFVQLVE